MIAPVLKIIAACFFSAILVYLVCSPIHSNASLVLTARTATVRQSILHTALAEEHYFVPASDENIHYVGRWTPSFDCLRWNTAFPEAYLDLVVRNASMIYISLNHVPSASKAKAHYNKFNLQQMVFKALDDRETAASSVALAVTDCHGNILQALSSKHGLTGFNLNGTTGHAECLVRISYAGGTLQETGSFQLKGIWLPKGATLKHRLQVGSERATDFGIVPEPDSLLRTRYGKTVELLTDSAHHGLGGTTRYKTEWLSKVAAQFKVDQLEISVHNHCLIEACTKMRSLNISTQDVFFRSGPAGSTLFARPWTFHHYVPNALVLDLGTTDHEAILRPSTKHTEGHIGLHNTQHSLESFTNSFVNAYMAFIQQIRRSAYPLHPSALELHTLDRDGYTYNSAPSTLPLFVMRPLRGSLEKATLSVVEQLQRDGDKSVFWIDTSGWVSATDYVSADMNQDLTAAGHAKVASFMHTHLCHCLALHPSKCPFSKRECYGGSAYVPIRAELDKVIEEHKVKKLTELFWNQQYWRMKYSRQPRGFSQQRS